MGPVCAVMVYKGQTFNQDEEIKVELSTNSRSILQESLGTQR